MGDQRRRGRGRSGRGGRIPRKGEGQPASIHVHDETFVSFPLSIGGPITVPGVLDEQAVGAALARAIGRERQLAGALSALQESVPDAVLARVQSEVEEHCARLERLARELGAEIAEEPAGPVSPGIRELALRQREALVDWSALQRLAYATGDRRIDRAVKPALAEKARHAEVLEAHALRQANLAFFRELE